MDCGCVTGLSGSLVVDGLVPRWLDDRQGTGGEALVTSWGPWGSLGRLWVGAEWLLERISW